MNLFTTTITKEAKEYVNKVLDSGFLNQGKYVDMLEEYLEHGWLMSNPLTLNSCTSALHLALILSNVKENDEVILPAQTFVSTGLSVLMCKARPVFADVDYNGNIDPESVKERITKQTKAVIAVHWGGTPAQMDKLYEICRGKGLWLIEDAAHALGAKYDGEPIGACNLSNFCCFSLQSIKTLTCGDGGILCINKDYKDIIHKSKLIRWFGMDKKNVLRNENGEREVNIDTLGYKYHMNDYNAALAYGNTYGLFDRIKKRKAIAEIFNNSLIGSGIRGIQKFPKAESAYWLYNIKVDRRNEFIKKLKSVGIPASTVDRRIDNNKIFEKFISSWDDLPNQEIFDETQVSIPCHDQLTIDDINLIIETINSGW